MTSQNSQTTEAGDAQHPVKDFLDSCGLDTSTFPIIKLVVETSDRSLRMHRVCIPIRFAEKPSEIFETYFRITRQMEVPRIEAAGHRKFLEIEWLIDPQAYSEAELHPANSFLASEMSCPSCRAHFSPKAVARDDESIKISCPQCLQDWILNIGRSAAQSSTPLLLDLFRKESEEVMKILESWNKNPISPSDSFYYSIFPYHFEKVQPTSYLTAILDRNTIWTALANETNANFEALVRGFINQISVGAITNKPISSALEKTDIQVKKVALSSETDSSADAESIPLAKDGKASGSQALYDSISKKKIENFAWAPDQFTHTHKVASTMSIRKRRLPLAIAASVLLSLGLATFLLRNSEQQVSVAHQQIEIAPIPAEPGVPAEPIAPLQNATEPEKGQSLAEAMVIPEAPSAEVKAEAVENPKADLLKAKMESQNAVRKVRKSLQKEKVLEPKADRNKRIDSAYRQGMLHLKLQQGKEAAEDFEQILKEDPDNISSMRGLGLAYFFDQKYDLSVKTFERYLEISKGGIDRENVEKMIKILRERAATASLTP